MSTSPNDKLNTLFDSFKNQQFDVEKLEKEIKVKRELIKRKEASLNELEIRCDEAENLCNSSKQKYSKTLEETKVLQKQVENEKSSKLVIYLELNAVENDIANIGIERMVNREKANSRLQEVNQDQFKYREEFKANLKRKNL